MRNTDVPHCNVPLFAAFSPSDGLFISSFSSVCQRQRFHNSHHFPVLPAGHGGGGRKSFFLLSMLIEAGTFSPGSHLCQIACVAVSRLPALPRSASGPPYPNAWSTMATSQPAELALQSRHSMAVASTSSLGIRLQPRSRAGLPGADAGAWHGAGGEHRAVTANASPTGGRAAGAGLLERGSLSSLEHGSLFHPALPETVRWSFIIDLIHI